MQFPNQTHTKGQFPEQGDAMLQGNDIVADLAQILGAALDHRSCLGGEQFAECGLCAFDLAGENGFAPHKGPFGDMGIG
jgi:hypothetical protein